MAWNRQIQAANIVFFLFFAHNRRGFSHGLTMLLYVKLGVYKQWFIPDVKCEQGFIIFYNVTRATPWFHCVTCQMVNMVYRFPMERAIYFSIAMFEYRGDFGEHIDKRDYLEPTGIWLVQQKFACITSRDVNLSNNVGSHECVAIIRQSTMTTFAPNSHVDE